jgi:prepilin-type N-terminal cleavage/methylation domain-containing protein
MRELGMTLLEMLLVLSIMGSVMVGAASLLDSYLAGTRNSIVAQQTTSFGQALQAYMQSNYATLLTLTNATTPVLVTSTLPTSPTPTLATYLPTGFNPVNSYGQTVCGLILQPTAGQLNAMVITESIAASATAIDDADLGQIAGAIGAAGGGIYSGNAGVSSSTTLNGTMGGWSISAALNAFTNANNAGKRCDGTTGGPVQFKPGHAAMALWFAGGDQAAGLLYTSAVNGYPALNTMNTPIQMGAPAQVAAWSNCTAQQAGSLTAGPANDQLTNRSAQGNGSAFSAQVLMCQGIPSTLGSTPTYTNYVWAPVPAPTFWNIADLPACDGSHTPYGQISVVLASTVPSGWNALPYVCGLSSGGAAQWMPVSIDVNGNFTVPGTATVLNLTVNQTINAKGTLNASAQTNISGQLNISGAVNVESTATLGTFCVGGGVAMSATGSGTLLTCQHNQWQPAVAPSMEFTQMWNIAYLEPGLVPCPAGWTGVGNWGPTEGTGQVGSGSIGNQSQTCYNTTGRRMYILPTTNPTDTAPGTNFYVSCPPGTNDLGYLGQWAEFYGTNGTSYYINNLKYCEYVPTY